MSADDLRTLAVITDVWTVWQLPDIHQTSRDLTTYKPSVGMGRSIWTSKNQIILFLLHSYLEGKPQWSLEELMLNVDIIMQLLLALLGKIKVAKSTYNVQRELKIWRSSQLTVESREDKPELEGIFPLAHCYQPFLIRRCQLGHSYLHHTFTPWPGHRRRAREGQRLPLTVSGVCLGIFFLFLPDPVTRSKPAMNLV